MHKKAKTMSKTDGFSTSECSKEPVVKKPNAPIPEKKRTDNVQGVIIMRVAAIITYAPIKTANGVNINSYIPEGRRLAPTENQVRIEIKLAKFIVLIRPKKRRSPILHFFGQII